MRFLYLVRQPDGSFWLFDSRPVRVGHEWRADGTGAGICISRALASMLTSDVPRLNDMEPVHIGVRSLCRDIFKASSVSTLQSADELY